MYCQLDLFEIIDEEKPYREERQESYISFNIPLKELDARFKRLMEDFES